MVAYGHLKHWMCSSQCGSLTGLPNHLVESLYTAQGALVLPLFSDRGQSLAHSTSSIDPRGEVGMFERWGA